MRSVKPGRGPSMIGGIAAAVMGVIGVAWTVGAGAMGAPGFFQIFGVCFVALAICMAIYHWKNAIGKNRHSTFDIVEGDEEPDPLNQRFGESGFCPQCGRKLPPDARFCPGCGREIAHE